MTASVEKANITHDKAPADAQNELPQTVNLDEVPDTLPSKFVLPKKMAKVRPKLSIRINGANAYISLSDHPSSS